jgi:hypothetical protein
MISIWQKVLACAVLSQAMKVKENVSVAADAADAADAAVLLVFLLKG